MQNMADVLGDELGHGMNITTLCTCARASAALLPPRLSTGTMLGEMAAAGRYGMLPSHQERDFHQKMQKFLPYIRSPTRYNLF